MAIPSVLRRASVENVVVAVVVVLGAASAGCAEEDYGPFRPPGGGGGGINTAGDARQPDAETDAAVTPLQGRVCVVTDLRQPDACPADPARVGVAVAVRGTMATAISDGVGAFTVATETTRVELDLAEGSSTLRRAIVPVTVGSSVVDAPVVTASAYSALLGSLGTVVPDGGGTVALYVERNNLPLAGVSFTSVAGSSVAPFYDAGGALVWAQGTATGVAGVTLFFDVPAGSATLDGVAADQTVVRVTSVPVVVDAVTFVRVVVAPP